MSKEMTELKKPITGEMLYMAVYASQGANWDANDRKDLWDKTASDLVKEIEKENIIIHRDSVKFENKAQIERVVKLINHGSRLMFFQRSRTIKILQEVFDRLEIKDETRC